MLKKKIYISLLFIANFILLAHSVIPHDHSEGLASVFTQEDAPDQNNGEFPGFNAPCHDCSFFCSLDDPGYISRNEPDLSIEDTYICGKFGYEETTESLKAPAIFNISSDYITCAIKSAGLRGPPLG